MSAAIEGFDCAEAERFLDAYVDGEFAETERAELEQHLAACTSCARKARFAGAFKAGLKAAAPRERAPDLVRARVLAALGREPAPQLGWRRTAWRVAPAAAAAVVLVGLAASTSRPSRVVADEAIESYARGLPLDVTGEATHVSQFLSPYVNFAVRLPQLDGAALVGARLSQIRDRRAAHLTYNVRGNRVSVIMFDPRDMPIEAPRHRDVGGRPIYLVGDRGYQVALVRDRGVGYAYTSDLGEEQMIQLVSSAMSH